MLLVPASSESLGEIVVFRLLKMRLRPLKSTLFILMIWFGSRSPPVEEAELQDVVLVEVDADQSFVYRGAVGKCTR